MIEQLELQQAITASQGLHGQVWEYNCSHTRLLYRTYDTEYPVESSIYFLCSACIRIEATVHLEEVYLSIQSIHDQRRIRYVLTDGDQIAIQCYLIEALRDQEHWIRLTGEWQEADITE